MRIAIALALAGCWHDAPIAAPAPAVAPAAHQPGIGGEVAITDVLVPEFSGHYRGAFVQLATDDEPATLALVRGCPALTCTPGPWEIEQVAHACPQAYIATLTVPSPTGGTIDMIVAGPAEHASTATIEQVELAFEVLGNDGADGSVMVDNADAKVSGSFKAEVCPRT
jgi:hypothetical protein